MNKNTIEIIIYTVAFIAIIVGALFVGKTTIGQGEFHVQRPVTAILFILTCVAGLFNK